MRLFTCDQQTDKKYWQDHNQQDFSNYDGPDYTHQLRDIEGLEVINWEISEPNLVSIGPSHKSNFFKWGMLDKESGVYADMDIVFVKPIDHWFHGIQDNDVAVCYQKSWDGTKESEHRVFSIGLMASSGNGDFFKDVYHQCVERFRAQIYQSAGVMVLYSMFGHPTQDANTHWNKMQDRYPDVRFANFAMDCVYPLTNIPKIFEPYATPLPKQTLAFTGMPDILWHNKGIPSLLLKLCQSTRVH